MFVFAWLLCECVFLACPFAAVLVFLIGARLFMT